MYSTQSPTVFALAADILPVQASSVPCECVFSSAKEIITPRRNRLTAKTIEALQIIKFSLKNTQGLDFMAGFRKSEVLKEIDAIDEAKNEVPSDLLTYKVYLRRPEAAE